MGIKTKKWDGEWEISTKYELIFVNDTVVIGFDGIELQAEVVDIDENYITLLYYDPISDKYIEFIINVKNIDSIERVLSIEDIY